MNYIWEVALQAKEDGIDEQELFFVPARDSSPYMEVSFTDLNLTMVKQKEIEVNPLYRFGEIFGTIFDCNVTEYKEARELFFDAALHYYMYWDLR